MTENERQDDPAMDGMLMEYHRLPSDVDDDLVDSVMRGVHSMDTRPRKLVTRVVWIGAAAAVAMVVGLVCLQFILPRKALGTVASHQATIQRGRDTLVLGKGMAILANDKALDESRFKLIDNSIVKTDELTVLRFGEPGNGQRAYMELLAGRAFFKVSKSPGKFIVKTDALVEVKGTIFGVSYRPKETETLVSVLEGTVQVSNDVGALDVHKGQSSKAQPSQAPSKTAVNPYDSMIWARDPVQFDNHPIVDVFTWIETNSNYTFTYDRAEMSDRLITIHITNEPISEVIDQVLLAGGLESERKDNVITVKPWQK